MKLPFSSLLILLILFSNNLLSQNTITVKKGAQIEGLYIGESFVENKKAFFNLSRGRFNSPNDRIQYMWFTKKGNACMGTFKNKKKKHANRVRECAENGNFCENLQMFSYKINDTFGDKGLSPYLHIEFYKIVATDSAKTKSEEFVYSKCTGELEDNILHIKGNLENYNKSIIYKLYFQED